MNKPKQVNKTLALCPAQPASASAIASASASIGVEGSWAAIQRAALRARQVAQQTGTDLIVIRAGQVVRLAPKPQPKPQN